MPVIILLTLVLVVVILSSGKKTSKYCWFAYFLSFATHVSLTYIFYSSDYIGKQNIGIAISSTEVIGLGLFLSALLRKKKMSRLSFKAHRRYLVYVLFSFFSLIYSYNRGMTINEIGTEVELLLVICLIAFYYRNKHFILFIYAILFNSVLQAFLCLLQMVTGISFRGGDLTIRYGVFRAQGLYITPSELAIISLVSFFLFLAIYLNKEYVINKRLLLIGMACNIVSMIGGQSRTGFVILFFGLILFAVLKNKKVRSDYKRLLRVTVMTGLGLVIVAFFLGEIDLGNSGEMLSSRISMWLMGLSVFEQHPILGIGNNAYTAFNSDFSTSFLRWEATNPVHNIYIMELAETGVVGFCLIFCCFYFSMIRFAFKKVLVSIYYEALFVIFFTQLLYGFTGWVFYSPSLRFFNMLILVVLLRMGDLELAKK